MSSSSQLPDGFFFGPTDQELLLSYLRRWVLGQPLPWYRIIERDLYGVNSNPWDLFSDNDPWNTLNADDGNDLGKAKKKTIYVFTILSKLGQQGNKNVIRTAGCGKWHGHTAPKDIVTGKNTKIGCKRMFTFKSTKKDFVGKGHWIMHEYSLSDAGLIDIGSTNYVVCRITKDESKNFKKQQVHESFPACGHGDADYQVLDYVEWSEKQEINRATLGKRKSVEDSYIPKEEKIPRWSVPNDHFVIIDFNTDVVQGNETEDIATEELVIQNNMVNFDASPMNSYMPTEEPQHSIANPESLRSDDDLREFASDLEDILAVDNSRAQSDQDSNGIATSPMEESVQNNTEKIDASVASSFTPQDLQHSLSDCGCSSSNDDMRSAKLDHISNGSAISSVEVSVQKNAEIVDDSAVDPLLLREMELSTAEYERLIENEEAFSSFIDNFFSGEFPEADSFSLDELDTSNFML